ncbi:MAG TPA: SIMPL domain-containing protein [Candidatus Acidoferrum sp.]|nr:SIMPL domain-containing protein [Candidatus Acidoferrum sp.]
MKTSLLLALGLLAQSSDCFSQASGNMAYGQPYGKLRPEQNERDKRLLQPGELPPGSNTMFVEASVLMNVLADEYVAVFAVAQEGATPVECHQKMDAVLKQFMDALKPLGIASNDLFVDFIAQEKIYEYRVQDNVAKEELAGFELKKNVSIHYHDKPLLDQLVLAAAAGKIFDLVKVDYVVKDPGPIQNRLMEEAASIIKRKAATYDKLFGIALSSPPQVYANKPSIYYPSEMYDTYSAFESQRVDRAMFQQKYAIQDLRKSRTFYFNALNANGFDTVINPVVVEPVVQFTIYLKLKYDLDLKKGKRDGRPAP